MSARLSATQIRDEQWVARYVAGRLSESEFQAFEEYCIEHPSMVDEVTLERRMQAALADAVKRTPTKFRSFTLGGWMLPAAAAVVLVIVGGAALISKPSVSSNGPLLASVASLGQQISSLAEVNLAQTRSTNVPSLGAASQSVMLVTLTGHFDLPGTYRVSLHDESGAQKSAELMLTASEAGSIRLVMNGARIPAGSYTIRVANVATADVQAFDFRKD